MPPVTALRSPPVSRMTGALSPVMALSSTEATPITISPSPGMNSPASTSTTSPLRRSALVVRKRRASSGSKAPLSADALELPGDDVAARLAQRVGLRLAAAFGHRLGEVGEEHREPEPERDRQDEAGGRLALAAERLHEEQRW